MVKALQEFSAEELRNELAFRSAEVGVPAAAPSGPIKLDLGCGKNKKPGFIGVDVLKFEGGVDVQCNLGDWTKNWPWLDATVEEVHASHFIEHLWFNPEKPERIHFFNELFRVLKPGGTATIITPHWNSPRQYGDYTHREPVSEWTYLYLSKAWREVNAPHGSLYTCDFPQPVIGYSPNMGLCAGRNQEYVQHMVTTARGGADDLCATLQKPLGAK